MCCHLIKTWRNLEKEKILHTSNLLDLPMGKVEKKVVHALAELYVGHRSLTKVEASSAAIASGRTSHESNSFRKTRVAMADELPVNEF